MTEGSRKVINGQEFFTRHVFSTELGNVMETVDGSFILSNGELAKNKEQLALLPEQYKIKALKWWEDNFGINKPAPAPEPTQEKVAMPSGPTTAVLLGRIEVLEDRLHVFEEDLTAALDRLSALEGVKSAKFGVDESTNPGKKGK